MTTPSRSETAGQVAGNQMLEQDIGIDNASDGRHISKRRAFA